MAASNNTGRIISTAAVAISCVLGTAASVYGIALAYLMGSRAQAMADDATPQSPEVLLRLSMQELIDRARGIASDPIDVKESTVEVNDVDDAIDVQIEA